MLPLLVSEVREEAVQPHDSHGGEHKEVGLPPSGALLRNTDTHTHSPKTGERHRMTASLHLCTVLVLHCFSQNWVEEKYSICAL